MPLVRSALALLLFTMIALPMGTASAEEEGTAPIPDPGPTESLPDPVHLLEAADALFTSQGISSLSAHLVVYRDPSDEISIADLRAGDPENRGLVPLQARYDYWAPNHYNFSMLGYLLASSETKGGAVQSYTSPLLPLPGGILATDTVLERFRVRVSGIQTYGEGREEVECYVLRLNPRDTTEFFKSLTYYITVDEPHLVRGVRASFDDGGAWAGTGFGSFYYKESNGRQLPFVGEGTVLLRNPDRKIIIKAKWRDYSITEGTAAPEAPVDEGETPAPSVAPEPQG